MTGLNGQIAELEQNAQITAAGRFWQLCMAQEISADPTLRRKPGEPTWLEERKAVKLVAAAGRRVVRLMFGVVLRDVAGRPGMFTPAMAALANSMALEIGENLQAFPFEERLRILEGLTRQMALGLEVGFAVEQPEAVQ